MSSEKVKQLETLFALRPTRREFLTYIGALLAASACGDGDGSESTQPPPAPVLASNPFTLGVASGDPLPEGVVLWTRLAIDPLNGGGMPNVDVPVIWEVALDEELRRIVRSGWRFAPQSLGHSVHVDVDGLGPDTWYFYRLRVGDQWLSPVARTRTLPALKASPERFRIGLASCQSYQDGYFNAHAFLAREDIDLVAFVGDYIYESGGAGPVRDHNGSTLRTLEDFRNRYGLYKSDAHLQAVHQRFPWILTWDDHEVSNNYAGLTLSAGAPPVDDVRALRAAGYQAYYEHMPLRVAPPRDFADLQIYRSVAIGDLATLYVLDGRQYRSDQACNDMPGRCPEVQNPARTMLGAPQKQWLQSSMRAASTVWNVIAQQVIFTPINFGGRFVIPDLWDGYEVERNELVNFFRDIRNVVVLTGDIHAAVFTTILANPLDATSEVVGHEAVCTSITSGGDTGELGFFADTIRQQHPYVQYLNQVNRGYTLCELTRESLRVQFRTVSTVLQPTAELLTDATFEVEAETRASRRVDT